LNLRWASSVQNRADGLVWSEAFPRQSKENERGKLEEIGAQGGSTISRPHYEKGSHTTGIYTLSETIQERTGDLQFRRKGGGARRICQLFRKKEGILTNGSGENKTGVLGVWHGNKANDAWQKKRGAPIFENSDPQKKKTLPGVASFSPYKNEERVS